MPATPLSRALTFLAAMVVMQGSAAEPIPSAPENSFVVAIDLPEHESSLFWKRFDAAFDSRAESVFADQFRSFKIVKWNIEMADRDFSVFHQRTGSAARHAFSKSAVDSAREAAASLPFFEWLETHQSFLARFLRNSVGDVEEESLQPLDVSYSGLERSWWRRLSHRSDWRYGVRPFKRDPYAYTSVGWKDGDQLIALAHLRYHYDSFSDHRFEVAFSVPLAHGIAIDIGTSYQFGPGGEKERMVLKLFKDFKGGRFAHVGFEVRKQPILFAGMGVSW